jgi:hypothetical protein
MLQALTNMHISPITLASKRSTATWAGLASYASDGVSRCYLSQSVRGSMQAISLGHFQDRPGLPPLCNARHLSISQENHTKQRVKLLVAGALVCHWEGLQGL